MAAHGSAKVAPDYGTSRAPREIASVSGANRDRAQACNPAVNVPRAAAVGDSPRWRVVSGEIGGRLFAFFVIAMLAIAWTNRDTGDLTPSTGLGYWLGVTGGVMMLLLLLYPARKSWRRLQNAGPMRLWFNTHIVLGLLGPALVVVHSNFQLSSINATIAMLTMLIVVLSGLFGRYIYTQIHIGLTGRQDELASLLSRMSEMRDAFDDETEHEAGLHASLNGYEAEFARLRASRFGSLRATLLLAWSGRRKLREIKAEARAIISARALRGHWERADLDRHLDSAMLLIEDYFATLRRASGLHFYSRLFRLWHVMHLPLYVLLIMAAIGHVVAVHLY